MFIELTDEQVSILLTELNHHSENLRLYAIGKPENVVAALFHRLDNLVPIRHTIFQALETHHKIEAKLSEYDEDSPQLSDYRDPTGS
jgi:hypothetical protein